VPRKPHPLVPACEFQRLLENGVVNNKAEIARKYDLSRARVTQIMNLLNLPSDIKEQILQLPQHQWCHFSERRLLKIIKAYPEPK